MIDTWANIPQDSRINWLWNENESEYLKVFTWLTTTRMCDIANPFYSTMRLSGLSNTVCDFFYYVPMDVSDKIESKSYWKNYSWICHTLLDNRYTELSTLIYSHFKMINDKEYKYPPIPKYLVELYYMS